MGDPIRGAFFNKRPEFSMEVRHVQVADINSFFRSIFSPSKEKIIHGINQFTGCKPRFWRTAAF